MKWLHALFILTMLTSAHAVDVSTSTTWLTLERYRPTPGSDETHTTCIALDSIVATTIIEKSDTYRVKIAVADIDDDGYFIYISCSNKSEATRIFKAINRYVK
jgi:hypothetical protein